mgnify:CR=1 FL=1
MTSCWLRFTQPATAVIIGGGVIGVELAEVMAGMGSTVTVLEMMPQILPALVVLRPLGSMAPASISFKSPLPMIQAAMPNGPHATRLRMPKTRMRVPR